MSNMELWYTENQTNNVNFSMKVKSHLYSKQSDFQKIDIIDTYEFGTEKVSLSINVKVLIIL